MVGDIITLHRNKIREFKKPFPLTEKLVQKRELNSLLERLGEPGAQVPPRSLFKGRGILIPGGGPVYFSSALVVSRLLRGLGCYLPIEIWLGEGEMVPLGLMNDLEREGIFICDATAIIKRQPQKQRNELHLILISPN